MQGDGQAAPDNWADRLATGIERVLDGLLGLMLLVMTVAVVWQVFGRYALDRAPGWSEELARFLVVWVTMLGAAAVLRSGGHVTITALLDALPPGLARGVVLVRDLLLLACALVLIWTGYRFAEINGFQASPAFEVPMSYVYGSLWIGAALVILMLGLSRLGRRGDWTRSGDEI
jgi:TRAP-type C4-dicarboxylate transport system permease small subunit